MPIMRLDFLVNIMLSVGIKYSLLDLLYDVNNKRYMAHSCVGELIVANQRRHGMRH